MKSFVINCESHKDRIEKFYKFADKAKMTVHREACVNGRAFNDRLICKMVKLGIVHKDASMTPIEVAIFLSHYNCWVRTLNSCANYGLVFEDDVEMYPDFITKMEKIMNSITNITKSTKITKSNAYSNFDILYLWNGNWMETPKTKTPITGVVREKQWFNAGAVSYILSSKYAKKLVEGAFPIRYAVDIYMGSKAPKNTVLSLKMGYRKKDSCYLSPVLNLECAGEYGTGTSTQDYTKPTVDAKLCVFSRKDRDGYSVKELKSIARKKRIPIPKNLKSKDDIIDHIKKVEKSRSTK
jgi:GR25 family glycosyltransferase involved in LPS biosynthesis